MIRERQIKIQPPTRRTPQLIVAICLLALLLLALDYGGMLGPLRSQAISVLNPALVWLNRISNNIRDVSSGFASTTELQATVTAQNEAIGELRAAEIENQALRLQITRLNQQLRIEQERPWKLVGADVNGFNPDTGRRTAFISAGSEQGVKVGMAVIGREGDGPPALIGVVEEVGTRSSAILLITDFSSSISAQINRPLSIVSGVVHGQWQHGSRLQMEDIDRSDSLTAGDVVVTAGLTSRYSISLPRAAIPRNIPIGTVESVTQDGRTQTAALHPFVDPDQVRYAWVILSTDA